MNIVVLSGSPRKGANTDTMVEAFAETAREGGHTVDVVRVASKKIAGCLGCQHCFTHEGTCVQKDDMADVIESLKGADMVVFASPIYWFDITAQEKAAIDRLYAFGATGFPFTKTALLLDSHSEGVYDAAIAMYKSTCAYCKWEDAGLFLDTVEILVQDGVGQFVRLLDRVVSECFEGLFAIPGTLFAQRIHNFQQAGRRLQFVLFHRIVSVF